MNVNGSQVGINFGSLPVLLVVSLAFCVFLARLLRVV